MKESAVALLSFALLLGATALAVETFDDRELMVPPPDAVAEGFVRETITGRYARARQYLSEPESMSNEDVRELEQFIESRVGEPTEVEAELVSRDDKRALVTVRVSAAERSEALSYGLVFDQEWKIAR
ncbi:MAG TPA: hypothetical protein VF883_18655 [Thermoanaerobaculia bacterium]|jgi:hypothetical protein